MKYKYKKQGVRSAFILGAIPLCLSAIFMQSAIASSDDSPTKVEGPKVKWHASLWGTRSGFTEGIEKLAEYVYEKTEGNFDISLEYGEALASANENIDGIQMGAFEAAAFCPMYSPRKAPVLGGLDLPNLPVSSLEGRYKLAEEYYTRPEVEGEFARWGATPLLAVGMPNYEIMGRGEAPVEIGDLQGLRLHSAGGLGRAMSKIGASVSVQTAPELFQSLERGVIDAVAFPYSYAFAAYRLYEVSDWVTEWSLGSPICHMVANSSAYESLPEQYQNLLEEGKAHAYAHQISMYSNADLENEKSFSDAGIKRVGLTEEISDALTEASQPDWDSWAESVTSNGVDGQDLLTFILETAQGFDD